MTPERRAWSRANLRVRVWVLMDGQKPVGYAARNLGTGGALLSEGPPIPSGRDVKLMLPLRGRDLVLHARVLRTEPDVQGRPCTAVCFRGMPTFVQDLIDDQVQGALTSASTAHT